MFTVVDCTNVKGGVGKTTTTLDVGYALGAHSKVLLIDLDPQANLTYAATGVFSEHTEKTLYEVLIAPMARPLHEIIVKTQHPNVVIAPGTIAMSSADLELAGRIGRELLLLRALETFSTFCQEHQVKIEYIVCDTPPNLGLLSVNALIACGTLVPYQNPRSGFIIPVAADVFSTMGIKHLKGTIAQLRANLRIPIPLIGAVATLVDNTKESQRFLKDIEEEFGPLLFETRIPRNVKVKEANNVRVLFDYAPESSGAQAYGNLTKEIMHRVTQ